MYADMYPSDEYESAGAFSPAPKSFCRPIEVVSDPVMSKAAKRALLASWASDLRAIENRPFLRRLDDGTELQIDDILDALKALDHLPEPQWPGQEVARPNAHI
jgi:hypothetical protein